MLGGSDGGGRLWGSDEVNVENWKALTRLVGHVAGMRLSHPFSHLAFSINAVFQMLWIWLGQGTIPCWHPSALTVPSGFGMA